MPPWDRYSQPAQSTPANSGTVITLPADPVEQERLRIAQQAAALAAAQAAQTNADRDADNARADRALALQESAATRTAEGAMTPAQRMEQQGRASRLNQLANQINRTQELFNAGPGSTTSGAERLLDYLPTDANAAFDVAGASLAQQGLAAFRVPGTGTVSDRDAMMFDRANLPTASTRDSAIQEQLRGMRDRVEEDLRSIGLPVPRWEGLPPPGPSAMNQLNMGGVAPQQAAGGGAQTTSIAMPAEMQAEHAQLIARLLEQGGGRMDPQTYARERMALDQRYNFESDEEPHVAWAGQLNDALGGGGGGTIPPIGPMEVPLNGAEQVWNNVATSPTGTGLANYADSAGFGGVSLLAGDQMGAANQANPTAALLGQIGGAITGTGALGKLGKETIGRALPGMFGGGWKARGARSLAGDVAYSGVYGANTGQDPTMSMLAGGIGSVGGQVAGKVVGGALSGAARSPAAQYLASRNIPLTTGQTIGGVAGRIEERAMSLPGIGDMIRNRRVDGLDAFGEEAFRQGGEPIGFKPTAIGQEGLAQFDDAIGDSYTNATRGAVVPIDPQLRSEIDAISGRARSTLPDDLAGKFNQAVRNRVDPLFSGRSIYAFPEPDSLSTPLNPTPTQMANLSNIESVPLDGLRSSQYKMDWQSNANGDYNTPLVDGFGDMPIAVRMANGETRLIDGNHRAVNAWNSGGRDMDMRVIDARRFDPENAGQPLSRDSDIDVDELFAQLGSPQSAAPDLIADSSPFATRAAITGEDYQQVRRGLGSYRNEVSKPGFEQDYRDALTEVESSITGQMMRGGGEGVVAGLNSSNSAYRNFRTLEDAANRASGGSVTDVPFQFSPNQLQRAGMKTQRNFPGARPFAELADAGAEVLPNRLANSQSADRLMQAGALGGLTAVGGAGGYVAGGDAQSATTGAAVPTLAMILAMMGGTKTGQKLITGALTQRPDQLRRLGTGIRRNSGLFGSAAIPLALPSN